MIRRRLGQVLMVIALAFAAVSTAPVHAQEPAPITTPGTVTAATSLPHSFWIPGAANASKLTYWSTGPLNRPALSTGALFLPPGDPPEGGWPVISWAHGTVGISDQCAPTVTGTVGSPYLTNWLSQGYAIVATDYVGLGTPGIHAYLDGPSAAHSVIDMVRAARAVEPSLSPRWLALGQSQGGQAAMVTAAIATRYAPELDYRGAVATGRRPIWRTLHHSWGRTFPACH